MLVLGFNGSPRKGFATQSLVEKVLQGAEQKGAETKLINLSKSNIAACIGCLACRKDGVCSIKDDMTDIIADIKTADAIVIGSPVYMMQMTSQTKAFVDRLFPLLKPDFTSNVKEGTKAQLVFTQGQPPESFRTYFDYTESMFKFFGFATQKTFAVGNTRAKGDLDKQEDAIQQAVEIGSNLV